MTKFRNHKKKWVSEAWGYDKWITIVTIFTTKVITLLDLCLQGCSPNTTQGLWDGRWRDPLLVVLTCLEESPFNRTLSGISRISALHRYSLISMRYPWSLNLFPKKNPWPHQGTDSCPPEPLNFSSLSTGCLWLESASVIYDLSQIHVSSSVSLSQILALYLQLLQFAYRKRSRSLISIEKVFRITCWSFCLHHLHLLLCIPLTAKLNFPKHRSSVLLQPDQENSTRFLQSSNMTSQKPLPSL